MTQVQNKFFPPPPESGADDLPYGAPEENEGRESEEISIRKRGAVKSDWSKGRRYRRRKRLIDYDPSLDYEMIGEALSQFTGFNDGRRWRAMTIPSTVPPGFLSNSTPAPYQGASGSGHAIGSGVARRAIQSEQRNAARVHDPVTEGALIGQNSMLQDQINMHEKYTTDQLMAAARTVMTRDHVAAPANVKMRILQGRRIHKPDLLDLLIRHEPLHGAVMAELNRTGVHKAKPGRKGKNAAPSTPATNYFFSESRLTTPPRPLAFSTDPINAPSSTDDAVPREQMAQSEAQRGVRDSAVNPELTPNHRRDFREPREGKASGRMPAHMQYEGGGKGGEGYRDAGNRR